MAQFRIADNHNDREMNYFWQLSTVSLLGRAVSAIKNNTHENLLCLIDVCFNVNQGKL